MIRIADSWFERTKVDDDITWLREPHVHPFIRCNIWHVRGRDAHMLVDTGMGVVSLREAAKDLFQKPVMAVASHAHFDHVGGMHEFEHRIVHKCEAEHLAGAADSMVLTKAQLGEEGVKLLADAGYAIDDELLISALPYPGFAPEAHVLRGAPAHRLVDEGDVIDLGDRHFEVLHLPGHSPGGIGLYERATETLFSGDAIYDGPLLWDLPGSNAEDYARTLRRLIELPVRVVHGGHDESFGAERMKQIGRKYLDLWGA